MSDIASETGGPLVPGRSCEGCTLCCKLLEVEPLDKPRAAWCPHCNQKAGCRIYDSRPAACRNFYCGWRRIAHLDDRWKPSKSKFLINYEEHSKRIVIHADPVRADAWRVEPFLTTLRSWARRAATERGLVIVWVGTRATIVMPDREIELGHVRDDQFIIPVERKGPTGPIIDYIACEPDDPRVANAQ